MKTDKELLMLAAKAADMGCTWLDDSDCMFWDGLPSMGIWNPLTDDGDALRLAVELGIAVRRISNKAMASSPAGQFDEYCDGDPCAAIRRAIVRAAAAIGENL